MNHKIALPFILFIYIGLVLPTVANNKFKANFTQGSKLFKQSKCLACHSTRIFKNKESKINTLSALEKQVRICDSRLSTHWFDDEIRHVVTYLNTLYYQLPDEKKIMDNNDITKK